MVNIIKQLNGNAAKIIATVILIILLWWFIGCQSAVPSLITPGEKVCRLELEAEIESLVAKANARLADLDRQDAIKSAILDKAAFISETGSINPVGLLNSLVSIGAIGIAVDSRRKLTLARTPTNKPTA